MANVILVGYGNMGRLHARILNKLGILGAVVESDAERKELARKETGVPSFSSLEDIQDADAFVVAVPTRFHEGVMDQITSKFPEVKGVLLEKPITQNYQTAAKLVQRLGDISKRVIVGHIEVYNPVVIKFLDLVKNGKYGKIRTFSIHRKGFVPEERLGSLSGILEDIGVHDFDIVTRLIGGRVRIMASGLERGGSMNSAIIVMRGDDFHGYFHFSREFAGKERTVELELEYATIVVDLIAQTIEVRGVADPKISNEGITIPHGPGSSLKLYGEPLLEEHLNLREVIRGGSPVVTMEDGLKTLRIVSACIESSVSGSAVEITL